MYLLILEAPFSSYVITSSICPSSELMNVYRAEI